MDKISKNFRRSEFACKCGCGFDTVDVELLRILQKVHDHFKTTVKINSGCRCIEHNRREGGLPGSRHLIGKAADIYVKNHDPKKVMSYLTSIVSEKHCGLGLYETFVHIDVRGTRARWDGR